MFPIKIKKNGGFTLVEVLVTVGIMSLILTTTFFVLNANLRLANNVKNSFIASSLLQEGMEVVRNIRDADWYNVNVFGASIPDGNWQVQWNSLTMRPNTNDFLNFDSSSGLYSYDGVSSPTLFKRQISIFTVQPNIEKKVLVTITWFDRSSKSLSAEEHLYNWK